MCKNIEDKHKTSFRDSAGEIAAHEHLDSEQLKLLKQTKHGI